MDLTYLRYSVFHKSTEDGRNSGGIWQQAGAGELCGLRRPILKQALRIDSWAKQLFQRLDVFGESLATGFGEAIEGLRLAQYELFLQPRTPASSSLSSCTPRLPSVPQSWSGAV